MTKLSLVFFSPLVLILIFRIATFSPVPIAEGCEIKGSWNLNRIENFSGLTDGLKSLETNTLRKTFINILSWDQPCERIANLQPQVAKTFAILEKHTIEN